MDRPHSKRRRLFCIRLRYFLIALLRLVVISRLGSRCLVNVSMLRVRSMLLFLMGLAPLLYGSMLM